MRHIERVARISIRFGEVRTAYSTVAMRFEAINTLADRKTGKVVEGHASIPQQSTELWTFACRRGGTWQVSAIQQPN